MDVRTKSSWPQQQHQQERSIDQEIHVIVHLPFKRPESFADHEVADEHQLPLNLAIGK
ncbi:hypothetical protein DFQ26_000508, partial [Actinomortierella ambigua]